MKPNFIVAAHYVVSSVCMMSIVALKEIKNESLKIVSVAVPVVLMAFFANMSYATIIGKASQFDSILTQAVQVGTGISAIVVLIVEDLISFLCFKTTEHCEKALLINALSFYSIAVLVCIACWFVYKWVVA
jgi:hypothetical protein